MIVGFKHKGLEKFFHTGSTAGIQAKHAKKLRLILTRLNSAGKIDDINFAGSQLHSLNGHMKGLWAISVSGNWRITFAFNDGRVDIVNYVDYH